MSMSGPPPDPPSDAQERWEQLTLAGRTVSLRLIRNPRARRYILRLGKDGIARVTIPNRGSWKGAREFVARNTAWLENQVLRHASRPVRSRTWGPGTEVLLHGQPTLLRAVDTPEGPHIALASEILPWPASTLDWRPPVESFLKTRALRELPPRTLDLARLHSLTVARVSIRNQRSRWGSCSRRRTISLNWRLVQTPDEVRDYIILHELMHLREMNHSQRFWDLVGLVCPNYLDCERWIKKHQHILLDHP